MKFSSNEFSFFHINKNAIIYYFIKARSFLHFQDLMMFLYLTLDVRIKLQIVIVLRNKLVHWPCLPSMSSPINIIKHTIKEQFFFFF